ncbi:MAG TPA: class I SAM-dependent methyltransferase [Lacunisphaera sp.]|jgi:2-polyprenyl-3-methyl-5-hydroxy-6-metoxy-1,4-benzoquinol methylase
MIRFRHRDASIVLKPGESWSAAGAETTYRDTVAESLWSIIEEVKSGTPWRKVVNDRYATSNPWLNQIVTSPARALFFQQNPPAKGSTVLDIGAGWGQIALPLAREHDAHVTALEPTPERLAFIREAARQERVADRMNFVESDFLEVEFEPVFDLVCCIGVLEWVPKFRPGDPREMQVEFLRRMRSVLRPGGSCCVGIENRLGLKYLMGSRDDHTGQRNISVFDATLASTKHRAATGEDLRAFTYSHAEYLQLFHEAGFTHIESFAAFPDYKLPQLILRFNDPVRFNRTLLETKIPPEHDGVDGHLLPDAEQFVSHYRSLAQMGIAHYFCPSFFFSLK